MWHSARVRQRDPNTGRFVTKTQQVELVNELGVNTTHRMGRTLYDDYLPALRGRKAARVYREMTDDATIGGFLFGIEALVRELDWAVEPANDTPAAADAAIFVEQCMNDMTHSWDEHVAAALSFLPYGFAPFEIVYRRRTEADGSQHADGKWGWRKFGYRPQDTVEYFQLDETGGYQAMIQSAGARSATIPIDKLIVYRTTSQRGPEGRSILRSGYRAWYMGKRAEEIMGIGVERDLAGLPVMRIPGESIVAKDTHYNVAVDIVTRVKRDEQEGILLPSDRDESGNYLYDFELLSAGGGSERLAGVLAIRRAWSQDVLGSVLADFMGLGRDAVGSRALADPKIELWQKALEWVADSIADTVTRYAVPRLMALNGYPRLAWPTVTHTPVQQTDVAALAAAMKDLAAGGVPLVVGEDDPAVPALRTMLGLPDADE